MPDTTTVYLPINTWVHIQAFTNASFNQRVTITDEAGKSKVLTGTGEHDHPIPDGNYSFTTPSHSSSPLGWRMTVKVESFNNGSWQPSQVSSGSCGVQYYSLVMVVSEDYVDNDWNDAVVLFTWWTPPTSRNLDDLRKS